MRATRYEAKSKKWFLEFESHYDTTYKARCLTCGKPHELITEADDNPEYYTSVALKCSACGGLVYFLVPVN